MNRRVHFYRAGVIERGTQYSWRPGWSWVNGPESEGTQPWMTKREAQKWAREQFGRRAVFHETLAEAQEAQR